MSTGVATIHEGKLYYRKIVGDVDTLIRETDVLELPGTIGIAHTRPSGDPDEVPQHPNLNMSETMALVTNGTTPRTKYCHLWDEAVDLLDQNGYSFVHHHPNPKDKSPKLSRNGEHLSPAEARVHLVDYYANKKGLDLADALTRACDHMYSDNVSVMISESSPDRIYACRTTRPMTVIVENGETYMATCRFAFPEELQNPAVDLPHFNACYMTRGGIHITDYRMKGETVAEMTPFTYAEAYRRFEALLKSDKAPLYFDELEFAAGDMRDLWEGGHTCVQHARLVYDLLWQFDKEGRLKREMRLQEKKYGNRHRWYFSLD
jgi:glucosamine--fructose-6-phosphate aminotransferase (isomerizing)